MKPDTEHQEDHAKFGKLRDRVYIPDVSGREWPDHYARKHIAHDRRKLDRTGDRTADKGGNESDSVRRQRINLFLTMFVGGVWHGAGWTFFLYGVCHGSFVVAHQVWRIRVSGPLGLVGKGWYKGAAQLLTFLVVVFTLVLFRAETVASAGYLYNQLFDPGSWAYTAGYLKTLQDTNLFTLMSLAGVTPNAPVIVFGCVLLAIAACWCLPSTWQLFQAYDVAFATPPAGRPAVIRFNWRPDWRWSAFIAVLFVISCLNLTQVSEFLYFQF